MGDIDNLDSAKKLINNVIKFYYQETKLKPISVKIEFVSDIYSRKLELAVTEEEKKEIIASKEFNKTINGTMILPINADDTAHILISLDTINNPSSNCQYISTVIHELTHLHDYYDFYLFHKCECKNIRAIDKCENFTPFQLWSEYNARRKGYYFYRYIMNLYNESSEEEQINFILNTECPVQMKYTKEQLIKSCNEPYQFVYNIIQFIGRFSVWNDLFSDSCNVKTLPIELIDAFDNRIINLYDFLYNHKSFKQIKSSFSQLDNLLRKFVKEQ